MQDASLGRPHKTIKRAIYAATAFSGLMMWSYYSGIAVVCMCLEGAVCDCTDYGIKAAETTGIVLAGLGMGLFALSFFRSRPRMISWV